MLYLPKLIPLIKKRNKMQLYYKKNKKFVKYNDPYAMDGLTNGYWLVRVYDGGKSIKTLLNPQYKDLVAALDFLQETLCHEIYLAGKMRPRSVKISDKEQMAWEVFQKIMGEDMPNYFQFLSCNDISQKAVNKIKDIMIENNLDINKIKRKYPKKVTKICNAISLLQIP